MVPWSFEVAGIPALLFLIPHPALLLSLRQRSHCVAQVGPKRSVLLPQSLRAEMAGACQFPNPGIEQVLPIHPTKASTEPGRWAYLDEQRTPSFLFTGVRTSHAMEGVGKLVQSWVMTQRSLFTGANAWEKRTKGRGQRKPRGAQRANKLQIASRHVMSRSPLY